MEARVLIPSEFTLVSREIAPQTSSTLCLCAQRRIKQGTRFMPHQGDVRLGYLPKQTVKQSTEIHTKLQMFGSYNEVIREQSGRSLRCCNWVSLLIAARVENTANLRASFTPDGKPEFEVLHTITPLSPLIVRFPEHFKIHNDVNKPSSQAIATILQDGPLDLSQELVSRTQFPSSPIINPISPTPSLCTSSPELSPIRGEASQHNVHRVRGQQRSLLPCEVCGKTFDRPSLLKRHMRTHTGERPHACDVCEKRFSTSSSLNTHRRIHSGEKPHACGVCGKRFTASSNLYYHRMTHTKEKPHKCSLCLKSFPTPGDLRSHQYVHSGAWPFRCSACGRGFSKQTNLRNHLFLHTGDKPHECLVCGKKFALACNLRAHAKTHEEEGDERADELNTVTKATNSKYLSPSPPSATTMIPSAINKPRSLGNKIKTLQPINHWELFSGIPVNSQPALDIGKMSSLWSSGCNVFPMSMEELQRSLMMEAHILLNALQQQ